MNDGNNNHNHNHNHHQVFNTRLFTKGRRTGALHSVKLLAVMYNDKVYFSRRNPNSDWLKNAMANPQVKVEYQGSIRQGQAALVEDQTLARKISDLKYDDQKRKQEARIVLEVTLL